MTLFNLYIFLLISFSYEIDESKTLIIYFSRAGENYSVGTVERGNTELIVDYLKEITKIKVFKIQPQIEYPVNYDETLKVVKNEQNINSRPQIIEPITNIDDYDTILLGYPVWYGHLPNIVKTQLELLNFEGKTIYPFNTHEGSETGNTINEIKETVPKAIIKNGFPLEGQYARKRDSRKDIRKWLKEKLNINLDNHKNNDIDYL